MLSETDIDCRAVVRDLNRKTTVKERFLGGQEQRQPRQLLRVDHETRTPISDGDAESILRQLAESCDSADVILVADYAKGVCTEFLIQGLINFGRTKSIPVLVDPGRSVPLSRYRGAWLLKPNRMEAGVLVGRSIHNVEEAIAAASQIIRMTEVDNLIITLDSDGAVIATREGSLQHLPTETRQVADITGAGDMFLAALGLAIGNQVELQQAVVVANGAAGLEVERNGSAAVALSELQGSLDMRTVRSDSKQIRNESLAHIRNNCRRTGQTIVFTNGCFDLLHAGHVQCLEEARQMGDVLIVGLNSDAGIKRLKGNDRPVIPQDDRIRMLSALACVSFVVLFEQDTPCELLELLQPDVLVKGGTYSKEEVVGREIVERNGGRVSVLSVIPGVSTTALISRIQNQEQNHVATNNH